MLRKAAQSTADIIRILSKKQTKGRAALADLRRFPANVDQIRVGSGSQQHSDDSLVTSETREIQGCSSLAVLHVYVGDTILPRYLRGFYWLASWYCRRWFRNLFMSMAKFFFVGGLRKFTLKIL